MARMIVGTFDIIQGVTVAVEIDPEVPFYIKRLPGVEVPPRTPNFNGFSEKGQPILHYWYIAREFEREALAAFKAACRSLVG